MARKSRPDRMAAALLVLVASGVLAACGAKADGGSAGAASPSGAADVHAAALQFSSCMRQRGYDISDPTFNEQGWPQFNEPDLRGNQQYEQARAQCRTALDAAAVAQGAPSKDEQQQQLLAFARCMRDHGVNMPDPPAEGGLHLDNNLLGAPSWKPAAEACQQHLSDKFKALVNGAPGGGKGGTGK